MSDPVTNAEVEDVLSSIRRLVSEDKRPLQAQKPAPVNDRLVLTPALRVAEPVEDHVEADTGGHDHSDNAEQMSETSEHEEVMFDDPAHDYEADPYNFDDEEDDGGESAALDLNAPEHDHTAQEAEAAPLERDDQHEHDDQVAQDAHDQQDDEADGMVKAASLSAKIEALETAIGNISDNWEPDDTGTDEYSGTDAPAMAWEDDIARDAMGAPLDDDQEDEAEEAVADSYFTPAPEAEPDHAPEPEQDAAREDSFSFSGEDQLIDEEALRDLVSDIVRAELQGALGERITRNVRKLVRREIHRALTAQDLE